MRQLLTCLGLAALAGCGPRVEEASSPAIVRSPAAPSIDLGSVQVERVDNPSGLLLDSPPRLGSFDGSVARLEFTTVRPIPPATVYYGADLLSPELEYPRYRKSATEPAGEEPMTTEHAIAIDVGSLESRQYESGLVAGGGGTVFWRIELWDPEAGRARQYDGRFAYRREGEPGEGSYLRAPCLTDGPFIDRVTHDGAIVSWTSDQPVAATVTLSDGRRIERDAARHHEVPIDGLRADTRYAYQIAPAGGFASPRYGFRTAPSPGSQRPFSFGYLSDSREGVGGAREQVNGVNSAVVQDFLTALYRRGADLICFGGDLVNGYTSSRSDYISQLRTWRAATQPVAARIPVYECVGNHEQLGDYTDLRLPGEERAIEAFCGRLGADSGEAIFTGLFVNPRGSRFGFGPPEPEAAAEQTGGPRTGPPYDETVYSFAYGNVHFVALNTNYWYTAGWGGPENMSDQAQTALALRLLGGNREGYVMDRQLAWLERDLAAAEADPNTDHIVIFLHEPPFPCGGHVEDAMYWRGESGEGLNDPSQPLGDVVAMRDRFWSLVARHAKVVAVLCGDEHNYSRMLVDATLDPAFEHPVWQIVSGGCGAPFYSQDADVPWADRVAAFARSTHYCLFEVDGPRIGLRVYDATGALLDEVPNL